MNEARRQDLSIKMKEKWVKAEYYSSLLGLPKEEVFNKYFDLCEKYKDYLESNKKNLFIKGVCQEIEQRIRFFERKNEALNIKEVKNHIEKDEGTHRSSIKEEREPLDYLKIMLWTINQIGSIEKAEKIFNAAKLALEAIKE